MSFEIPQGWRDVLAGETTKPYFADLAEFVEIERDEHVVYPPANQVFTAYELTHFAAVKVLILGQDPYHGPGQAHGLSFSVPPGIRVPPSLKNIFKELHSDLGIEIPAHGHLAEWAKQGVMMLNTVLTVREGAANSHRKKGWEQFTDATIRAVNKKSEPVVFVLWGAHAQKKLELIDEVKHVVVTSPHPSPLSARHGFFGSKPFSKINAALQSWQASPIDWTLS